MLKRTALCILTLAAACLASRAANPEVWLAPSDAAAGGYRALFDHPEQWAQTRAHVNVLAYADHRLDKDFSDDELRTYLPMIDRWGLKLGLEVGSIKPWGKTGQKTFDVQRRKWDRFGSLGGNCLLYTSPSPRD